MRREGRDPSGFGRGGASPSRTVRERTRRGKDGPGSWHLPHDKEKKTLGCRDVSWKEAVYTRYKEKKIQTFLFYLHHGLNQEKGKKKERSAHPLVGFPPQHERVMPGFGERRSRHNVSTPLWVLGGEGKGGPRPAYYMQVNFSFTVRRTEKEKGKKPSPS